MHEFFLHIDKKPSGDARTEADYTEKEKEEEEGVDERLAERLAAVSDGTR